MTDKNPFEDISTDLLTEDFAEATQSLNQLVAQHKLIQYLENVVVASQMAQEAVLLTRENVDINPDN